MRDKLNRSFQGSVSTGSLQLINVLRFLATESKHTKSDVSKKNPTKESYSRTLLNGLP